jgi:hypothetical protein
LFTMPTLYNLPPTIADRISPRRQRMGLLTTRFPQQQLELIGQLAGSVNASPGSVVRALVADALERIDAAKRQQPPTQAAPAARAKHPWGMV